MRLVRARSRQNTYIFTRPVTKDGQLTGYAKILLFIDAQDKSWNRLELVNKVLTRNLQGRKDRGTMCNIFATFNVNDILTYSKTNKTWSKGKNFEEYMSTYLADYRK